MTSIDPTPEAVSKFDAVLIITDHDAFDWRAVFDHAALIVDTRSVSRKLPCGSREELTVVRA